MRLNGAYLAEVCVVVLVLVAVLALVCWYAVAASATDGLCLAVTYMKGHNG